MHAPNESLKDFSGRGADRKQPEPPEIALVRPLGTVQRLEPLARWEGPVNRRSGRSAAGRGRGVSWFYTSLTVSSALAIVGLILASFLSTRIFEPRAVRDTGSDDVAAAQQPDYMLGTAPDSITAGLMPDGDFAPAVNDVREVRSVWRQRRAGRRAFYSAYRSRYVLPKPRFVISDFVPTTLVIYVENGFVKSRIEPQIAPASRVVKLPVS